MGIGYPFSNFDHCFPCTYNDVCKSAYSTTQFTELRKKNIIDNNKDPVRSNLHHGSSQTQAHPSCTLNPPETTARKDSRRTERDRNLPRRLLYLPQRLMQNPRGRKTSCNMMLIRGRCVFTNLCAVIRLGLPHGVMRRERSVLQQCTYRYDWQRMSL
jgi:hypothetical protein